MTDVFIHIGQHKTGSKALQAYLLHNQNALLKQKIYYPKIVAHGDIAYQRSHFCLFAIAKYEALKTLNRDHEAKIFWEKHRKFCNKNNVHALLLGIEIERKTLGANRIILSAEDLFDMATAHELYVESEILECATSIIHSACISVGWRPWIIAYLRRPDQLVQATYAQYIKGSDKHIMHFQPYLKAYKARLDAKTTLKIWGNIFNHDAIMVRPYDGSAQSSITKDFLINAIKLDSLKGLESNPEDIESANRTPASEFIELMREMNQRRLEGRSFIPRTIILQFAYDHDCKTSPTWLSDTQIQLFFNRFENDFKEIAKLYGVKGLFKGPWNNPVITKPTCNLTRDEINKKLEAFYIVPSFFSKLKTKTKCTFRKYLNWDK